MAKHGSSLNVRRTRPRSRCFRCRSRNSAHRSHQPITTVTSPPCCVARRVADRSHWRALLLAPGRPSHSVSVSRNVRALSSPR
jgi:hypothetical protein